MWSFMYIHIQLEEGRYHVLIQHLIDWFEGVSFYKYERQHVFMSYRAHETDCGLDADYHASGSHEHEKKSPIIYRPCESLFKYIKLFLDFWFNFSVLTNAVLKEQN